VPGYYPGGKTGTAEKVGVHGTYRKHTNVSAFISVFPMNAPRYAVYMMLDEPHGNKSTYGYSTAGWVVAPAAGKVIARIGPMLGMLPDIKDMAAINQELAIPLQPARPPGAVALGPWSKPIPTETAAKTTSRKGRPDLTVPATVLPPAMSRPERTIRRETKYDRPTVGETRIVSAVTPVAAR
jgi:cell division protein FtsI (penicillin-binding protein 3)